MATKRTHNNKETGAKITTIYQDNGWVLEIIQWPDGTVEQIFSK